MHAWLMLLDQFIFINVFPSNFVLPGWIIYRIISSGIQKHNKSYLYDFPLYINIIILYSFKNQHGQDSQIIK